jgi:hypothetical protein
MQSSVELEDRLGRSEVKNRQSTKFVQSHDTVTALASNFDLHLDESSTPT